MKNRTEVREKVEFWSCVLCDTVECHSVCNFEKIKKGALGLV